MLPLRNTWLGDVHTKLTTAGGLHQLGKAAPRIHVHFQWKRDLLRRQVGQICGVQLLGEASGRYLRHGQSLRLCLEGFQQRHDLAQRHTVGGRDGAKPPRVTRDCNQTVKLTAVLPAPQCVQHFKDQIVNIEQLQLYGGITHGDRQIVGYIVAERGHGAVIVGAAPLPEQVGKAVYQHLSARLGSIVEKQLLPCQLGLAVIAVLVTADPCSLNGRGKHDRTGITVLFQRIQQS